MKIYRYDIELSDDNDRDYHKTGIIVSENKESSKKILFSILPVSFFINIILTIFLIFTSHFISFNLLKN